MQLDLFSSSEFDYLNQEVEKYKSFSQNVQRGVFSRLDALKKEQNSRIDKVENDLKTIVQVLSTLLSQKSNVIEFETLAM